jgi:hypothetical protein
MIKRFDQYINEGIRDMMTPKSTEDVKNAIEKLSPYRALAKAKKYGVNDLIDICLEKTKPINEKLYQDTKNFNKKTLGEFIDFVCTWIDEQGGESYSIDEKFRDIVLSMGDALEEGEEYEDDNGEVISPDDVAEESFYSENTINLFKQFVISYVIDYMSNSTYVKEDEEEVDMDGDELGWDDERDDYGEEDRSLDDFHLMVATEIVGLYKEEGIEVNRDMVETVLYNHFEDDIEEAFGYNIEPNIFANTVKSSKRFTDNLQLKKEVDLKKETDKKPISKIKKFLGFDKDE